MGGLEESTNGHSGQQMAPAVEGGKWVREGGNWGDPLVGDSFQGSNIKCRKPFNILHLIIEE